MLYIGHFSFDETNYEARFGHFTCVVEAKSPDEAGKAFKKLILSLRKKKALFSTAPADIYLDSIIEVKGVPQTGVVTWYSSISGEKEGSLSTALPHEDAGECTRYHYYPDERPDIIEKIEALEEHEVMPFVSFEPTATQKKAALAREEFERSRRQPIPQTRKPFSKKHAW